MFATLFYWRKWAWQDKKQIELYRGGVLSRTWTNIHLFTLCGILYSYFDSESPGIKTDSNSNWSKNMYRILLKTNVCSKPTKTRINPRVTVLKRTEEISFYLIVILEVTPLASGGSVFEKSEREARKIA